MLYSLIFALILLLISAGRFMFATFFPNVNVSFIYLFIVFLCLIIQSNNKLIFNKKSILKLAVIYLLILSSTIFNSIIKFNSTNVINGLFVVPIFLFIILCISRLFTENEISLVNYSFRISFYILLFFGWLTIIWPDLNALLGYGQYSHPCFPFTEPSHYAITIFPFASSAGILASNKTKLFITINFFLQAICFPNLTLIIASCILTLIFWGLSDIKRVLIFFIFLPLFISTFLLQVDYFSRRINDFGSDSNNLSVLIYIQGWQEIENSFKQTNGLGLGYRQMGSNNPPEITSVINAMGYEDLNRLDGSFLVSHLLVEFGIIGFAMLVFYLKFLVTKYYDLKQFTNIKLNDKLKFLYVLVATLSLELFFRGGDYFSSTVLLSLAALLSYPITKNRCSHETGIG